MENIIFIKICGEESACGGDEYRSILLDNGTIHWYNMDLEERVKGEQKMLLYKLQMGCMVILLIIAFLYWKERIRIRKIQHIKVFDQILVSGIIYMIFDIASVYTVNHLDTVSDFINRLCHIGFLVSLNIIVFLFFYYILNITELVDEQNKKRNIYIWLPLIINVIMVIMNIGSLEFRVGRLSNYSMGISVYACYVMVVVEVMLTITMFAGRWRYIERYKRDSIGIILGMVSIVFLFQITIPDSLVSCVAVTTIIVGIYTNMENPAKTELENYHEELMSGFANIIESRDGSTGGHVKRTTSYVEFMARELRKRGYYKNILTKDYISNLVKAAPLHDIGKISTPDAILQKPGKLTDEEYVRMKEHAEKGAEIIRNSLGKLGDKEYIDMAYQVALYHHERWDGKGYPTGKQKENIPLCARIMAVADVFDAVVEKRCYREAMTLDEGFAIIQDGIGKNFDPVIAGIFVEERQQVEQIYNSYKRENL